MKPVAIMRLPSGSVRTLTTDHPFSELKYVTPSTVHLILSTLQRYESFAACIVKKYYRVLL